MEPQPPTATVRRLLSAPKFGSGIGFHRVGLLLESLLGSTWGHRFTTIRVTGSNGKGSVTALIHAILRRLGIHCGRFTSPHLFRFNERILLGDVEISDMELDRAFSWVEKEMSHRQAELTDEQFGSFELIAALCVRSFFDAEIAAGVVEAGIGGRFDTTRLLPGSLVALTSIDLEHAELLGGTRELIAYDKLDLCPEGGTVVVRCPDTDLRKRIWAYGKVRQLKLVDADDYCRTECVGVEFGSSPWMKTRVKTAKLDCEAMTSLIGIHQLENIAVAVATVELWTSEFMPHLKASDLESAVKSGLQQTRWPGRFERISTDPACFIDVGHSPDACIRLVESVKKFLVGRRILLVTGVSANKAVSEILELLVPLGDQVICTRAYHNGEQVGRIAGLAREFAPCKVIHEAETIEAAATLARDLSTADDSVVLVAGGLFLAVEFQVAWEGGDPTRLSFL
jgi:dihydrofolate synthase/folylpolyglutamate synthase